MWASTLALGYTAVYNMQRYPSDVSGGPMKTIPVALVISIVIGAYVVATIFQIFMTKRGLLEGRSFPRSGAYASLLSFFVSIAIIILFLVIMYFLASVIQGA